MVALASWLFGGGAVPTEALVWASGSVVLAAILAGLLLASVAVLVAVREPTGAAHQRHMRPQHHDLTTKGNAPLPSAA